MTIPFDLHADLAEAARTMHAARDTQHTIDRSVALATELIPNCHYAGIAIVHRDLTITTPAFTDQLVQRGDQLQYQLSEGPCVDAMRLQHTVLSPDLTSETRWPRWAARVAAELNVRSILCLQLFTTANLVGALNLYSIECGAFDNDDIDIGTYLAAHVAVAVAETQQADEIRLGAVNRTLIGQAQGILMERFRLDATQAFQVMRRVSQDGNRKLLTIARELVETRVTPGTEALAAPPLARR